MFISRQCNIGYLYFIEFILLYIIFLLVTFRHRPRAVPLFRGVHSLYKKQFIRCVNKCVHNVLYFTYYEYVYIERC